MHDACSGSLTDDATAQNALKGYSCCSSDGAADVLGRDEREEGVEIQHGVNLGPVCAGGNGTLEFSSMVSGAFRSHAFSRTLVCDFQALLQISDCLEAKFLCITTFSHSRCIRRRVTVVDQALVNGFHK